MDFLYIADPLDNRLNLKLSLMKVYGLNWRYRKVVLFMEVSNYYCFRINIIVLWQTSGKIIGNHVKFIEDTFLLIVGEECARLRRSKRPQTPLRSIVNGRKTKLLFRITQHPSVFCTKLSLNI